MNIQENIQKVRAELVEFIQVCGEDFEDSKKLTEILQSLTDGEVLELFIQSTFDNEWRGDYIASLCAKV
ncbi:hypothetical protein [Lysinibacillus fusiformis]|uniref:hypothetical protein n=1 Tax=Lysinibacillus fusiformis TaxID=28031 RepID=UPI000D3642F5|nr:hypothetical protein [Lysinibacillus fusiformis]MED4672369.1 hypothetical protein [Lysinibacillus fusiformis]RDV32234.1 hypothetical protein C7B90_10950 [Lysinibacillus fusiformis]GED65590.1 hypothetical protein LFU01_40420 [Lysinibacillus fusiformis]